MAEEKIDKLEQKKKELEEELQKIQHELDDSIQKVRSDVTTQLSPAGFIKDHPLPVVGLSLLTGFILGSKRTGNSTGSSDRNFGSLLLSELKRVATKKGLSIASDYIERILLEDEGKSANNSVKKD